MREIKFRVWDKDVKTMHVLGTDSHDSIQFINQHACYYNLQNGCGSLPNGKGSYDLMQFTGLHDKNGKEVYEGDIVRRDFEVGTEIFDPVTYGFVDYEIKESGYFIGKVHYRPSEGFVLNNCLKYDSDGELLETKSGVKIYSRFAEVIGNIYENPELLEVAK